jgi:hypothetical protein
MISGGFALKTYFADGDCDAAPVFKAGGGFHSDEEQTVRIEEPGARADAVTAAQALTHPTFKQVCGDEGLAAGEHIDVSRLAFVFVELAKRHGCI